MYVSIFLSYLFDDHSEVFWFLFAFSILMAIMFFIFSSRYLLKWRSIVSHLGHDSLPITCIYLVALDKIKKQNRSFCVNNIDATFSIDTVKTIDSGKQAYPVTIDYIVSGFTKSPFSIVYYNLLAKSLRQSLHSIEYSFDDDNLSSAEHYEYQSDNITAYSLVRSKKYTHDEVVKYHIRISFDASEGVVVEKTQRFIISAQNFSNRFEKKAKLNIKLSMPSSFQDHFKEPRIKRYKDGLNYTEEDDLFSFQSKTVGDGYKEFMNSFNIMSNELYCIEFSSKDIKHS